MAVRLEIHRSASVLMKRLGREEINRRWIVRLKKFAWKGAQPGRWVGLLTGAADGATGSKALEEK